MVEITFGAEYANCDTGKRENNCGPLEDASNEAVSVADIHALLHGFLKTSEASEGCGLRCGWGHAILNILTLEHLDVKLQLILNLKHNLLAVVNLEQVGQDGFHR